MQETTLGLIVLLVLGLLVLPLGAEAAQPGEVVRIGVLYPSAPPAETAPSPLLLDALRHALREQGWVEGHNLTLEVRYAAGQYERLPALAAELVQLPVDVIVAEATAAAQAARHATRTIPIVFIAVGYPVESGLVASLAQPGANVTGVTHQMPEFTQKRLQLFTEAVPQMSRVAVLWNPTNPGNQLTLPEAEQAARALGVSLHALAVRDLTELEHAFHAIIQAQPNGLFMLADPFLVMQGRRIAQFALEHRLPTNCPTSSCVN